MKLLHVTNNVLFCSMSRFGQFTCTEHNSSKYKFNAISSTEFCMDITRILYLE